MTSLREILARESERSNLRSVAICVGAVLVLVVAAFVVSYTDFTTPEAAKANQGASGASNAGP